MVSTKYIWLVIRRSDLNISISHKQKLEYLFMSQIIFFFLNAGWDLAHIVNSCEKNPPTSFEAWPILSKRMSLYLRKSHKLKKNIFFASTLREFLHVFQTRISLSFVWEENKFYLVLFIILWILFIIFLIFMLPTESVYLLFGMQNFFLFSYVYYFVDYFYDCGCVLSFWTCQNNLNNQVSRQKKMHMPDNIKVSSGNSQLKKN